MQLAGAVALVTGGSSGLGAALCRRLAAKGARVLVHGRDEARAHAVADEVRGDTVLADLAEPEQPADLARRALAVHGRVDLLVNNAGIGWSGRFTRMPADLIGHLVAVNLTAPIRLTRELLPSMVEQRHGHVCFIGSVAGRTGVAGESAYAATKSGIDVFAESLRMEVADTGVGVSIAIPGVIDTEFFSHRGRPYDRRRPEPIPAEDAADAIADMIEHDGSEQWIPAWLRAGDVARHMAPGAYRRLAARFGERT